MYPSDIVFQRMPLQLLTFCLPSEQSISLMSLLNSSTFNVTSPTALLKSSFFLMIYFFPIMVLDCTGVTACCRLRIVFYCLASFSNSLSRFLTVWYSKDRFFINLSPVVLSKNWRTSSDISSSSLSYSSLLPISSI